MTCSKLQLLQELKEEHEQLLKEVSALESVKNNIVNKLKRRVPESKIQNALRRIDCADIIQNKNRDHKGKIVERAKSGDSNDMMEQINTYEVVEQVPDEVQDVATESDDMVINISTLATNPISYPTQDYHFINCFEDSARPIDDDIDCFEIGTAMSVCDQTVLSMVDTGVEVDGPIEQDCVIGNLINLDSIYCLLQN